MMDSIDEKLFFGIEKFFTYFDKISISILTIFPLDNLDKLVNL